MSQVNPQSFPFRPRKRFGQNFLKDPSILERIADAAHVQSDETVIEIGPGPGTLTEILLSKSKKVIGLELDWEILKVLREKYGSDPRLEIVEGDAVKTLPGVMEKFPKSPVIGNIPYQISSPLIFMFMEMLVPPRCVVLLVQKEFAERVTAFDHSRDCGALTIMCRVWFHAEMLFQVSRHNFTPPPQVESAVIRLTPHEAMIERERFPEFQKFVRQAFMQRRKMLKNVLDNREGRIEAALEEVGLPQKIRPEEIRAETWVKLFNMMTKL